MRKSGWTSKASFTLVMSLLLLVSNPELRALLFLANGLGVEVLFTLLIFQLRSYLPVAIAYCKLAANGSLVLMRTATRALPWLVFALLPHAYLLLSVNVPALHRLSQRLKCCGHG